MQHLQPNTTLQGGKYKIERVQDRALREAKRNFAKRPNEKAPNDQTKMSQTTNFC